MKIRAVIGLALLALVVAALWFLLKTGALPSETRSVAETPRAIPTVPAPESGPVLSPPDSSPSGTPLASSSPANPAVLPPTASRPALSAPAPNSSPLAPPDSRNRTTAESLEVELDKIHHMITSYHTLMDENPVGTNAEIMKALMGGNPRQATLGDSADQVLNDKGELVDPWGTPYFFHQLSRDRMEITSSGPDKIIGTDDDQVFR